MQVDVKKVAYWQPVALDADGTPLLRGERMVEVEPGVWKDPVIVAAENFLRPYVARLMEESGAGSQ